MLKYTKTLRDRVAVIGVASAFAFTPLVISPVIAQTLQPEQNDSTQIIEEGQNDLQNDENAASDENTGTPDQTAVEENQLDPESDRMAIEGEAAPESGDPVAQDDLPDSETDSFADDDSASGMGSDALTQDEGSAIGDDSMASDRDATESADGIDPMTSAAISLDDGEMYVLEQSEDQVMANNYIGKSVYNDEQEKVGDIRDLVFTKDGGVQAAVIGVGGFLGLGQKQVAVSFDQIRIVENPETAELELYISANKDQLAEAPEFTTKEDKLAEARSNDAGAGTGAADTANPMAPATPVQPTE